MNGPALLVRSVNRRDEPPGYQLVTRAPCATLAWFQKKFTTESLLWVGFSSFMGTMISGNSKLICELPTGTRCDHFAPLIPSACSSRGVPLVSSENILGISSMTLSVSTSTRSRSTSVARNAKSLHASKRDLRFSWRTWYFWVHVRFKMQRYMPCHVHIYSDDHLVSFFQYFWVHSTWRSAQVLWVIS